jgi:hypothetical protein
MQNTISKDETALIWLVDFLDTHGYEDALAIEYFGEFDNDSKNTFELIECLMDKGVCVRN